MKPELQWAICLPALIAGMIAFKYLLWWIWDLPCKVECWFCMKRTKVRNSRLNSWFCPSCEQYNGFGKDGGYNMRLPRLFKEKLNRCPTLFGRCKNSFKTNKSLCRDCNRLQEIKVRQLADFVPLNHKNYDQEIEHFKEQLEKALTLCAKCDLLLREVFEGERAQFRMPKRLRAALNKVTFGGKTMVTVIVLSIAVCLLALHRLHLIPPLIPWRTLEAVTPLVAVIRKEINRAPHLIHYGLLASGILANGFGFYRTQNWIVGLNSLSWIATFCLHVFLEDRISFIFRLQAISGLVSMILSIFVLVEMKLKKESGKFDELYYNSCFQTPLNSSSSVRSESKFEENLQKSFEQPPPRRDLKNVAPGPAAHSSPTDRADDSYNLWRLQRLRLDSPSRSKPSTSCTPRIVVSPDEGGNWWDGLDSSNSGPFWGRRTPGSGSVLLPSKFHPKPKSRASTLYNFDRNSESPPDLDYMSSWSAPALGSSTMSWYRQRPPPPTPHPVQPPAQLCCCATLSNCTNSIESRCDPPSPVFKLSPSATPPPPKEEAACSHFNFSSFLQGMCCLSFIGLFGLNLFLWWAIQSSPNGVQFLSTKN